MRLIPRSKTVQAAVIGGIFLIAATIITVLFSRAPQPSQIVNSSNSPMIQNSSNVSITYSATGPSDPFPQKMSFTMDPLFPGTVYDFFRVEIILPDREILFIPQVLHDQHYNPFDSNPDLSQFSVSQPYRITESFETQNVCFLATFPNPPSLSTNFSRGPAFNKNNDCYRLISGPNALAAIWGH
jgi:hypothetical protein